MFNQVINSTNSVLSHDNPKNLSESCLNVIRLSQCFNSLGAEEMTELMKGAIFIFKEAQETYEEISPHDIYEGFKRVLASMSGHCLMGYPVKFDARTLRSDD